MKGWDWSKREGNSDVDEDLTPSQVTARLNKLFNSKAARESCDLIPYSRSKQRPNPPLNTLEAEAVRGAIMPDDDGNNAPADNQEPPAASTLLETSSDVNPSENQGTQVEETAGQLSVKKRRSSLIQSFAKRSRRSPPQPVPQVVNLMAEDLTIGPSTNLSLESQTQQPLPASIKQKKLITKKRIKFQIPDSEPQLDSSNAGAEQSDSLVGHQSPVMPLLLEGNKIKASSIAAAGSPPSSSILEAQPSDAKIQIKALASQLVRLADQVVNADFIQAKDELAAQKEETKSLKADLEKQKEQYSRMKDFWRNSLGKVKNDLENTKASLRVISAEKETAQKSLKAVQAELEENKSGLAQALSDREKMKENITGHMNEAGITSASTVLAMFKDHYPDLDISVINKGFKREKVEARELIESFEDLAQPLVEKLNFSYSGSDDEENSPYSGSDDEENSPYSGSDDEEKSPSTDWM